MCNSVLAALAVLESSASYCMSQRLHAHVDSRMHTPCVKLGNEHASAPPERLRTALRSYQAVTAMQAHIKLLLLQWSAVITS
jgi:hypothetical protein